MYHCYPTNIVGKYLFQQNYFFTKNVGMEVFLTKYMELKIQNAIISLSADTGLVEKAV